MQQCTHPGCCMLGQACPGLLGESSAQRGNASAARCLLEADHCSAWAHPLNLSGGQVVSEMGKNDRRNGKTKGAVMRGILAELAGSQAALDALISRSELDQTVNFANGDWCASAVAESCMHSCAS